MIWFRAILLLLALGLGVVSQIVPGSAMAAETARPDRIIAAYGAGCGGPNADHRQCAAATGCVVSCEWTMSAIVPEGVPFGPAVDAPFAYPAQVMLLDAASAPEPYPPRF